MSSKEKRERERERNREGSERKGGWEGERYRRWLLSYLFGSDHAETLNRTQKMEVRAPKREEKQRRK